MERARKQALEHTWGLILGLSPTPSLVGLRAFLVLLKTTRVVRNPSWVSCDCFDCIEMLFICYIQYCISFILRPQILPPHYKLRKEAITVYVQSDFYFGWQWSSDTGLAMLTCQRPSWTYCNPLRFGVAAGQMSPLRFQEGTNSLSMPFLFWQP